MLQNCHEEILFMWSSRSYPDESTENLPDHFGLPSEPATFLMMMVVYEAVEDPFYDSSGLDLFYRQETTFGQTIRRAKRFV